MASPGRPSVYSEELADEICARIVEGNSARSVCKSLGIGITTMFRWLREKEEFRQQYARACQERADTLAEEIVEIADNSTGDWHEDKDGRQVFDHEHVQRDRLRVDARKWAAARMNPRKWGDRQEIEHRGLEKVTGDAMRPEDWASQYAKEGEDSQESVH